jgi:hypothetical protein
MPSSTSGERRTLADYPASLQSAARALWGDDDFWGRYQPRPVKAPEAKKRVRR